MSTPAVTRSIAFFISLFFLLFLPSSAFAALGNTSSADEGLAYQNCHRVGAEAVAYYQPNMPTQQVLYRCDRNAAAKSYTTVVYGSVGGALGSYAHAWQGGTCLSRPEQTGWMPSSEQVCFNGCAYGLYRDPDLGTYYSTLNEVTGVAYGVCKSGEIAEPKVDTDGDGVPDEEDAFPNDPNESKDSDGDGIGDNADIAPDDPKNGEDDGEGDEKDNKAGGGGDCKSPPTCSGDGIQCNQLYQLWRARCAVEGQGGSVTGAPGDCRSSYKCEGNSVACAQLSVQRQQLCGTGDGDGDGNGTVTGTGSCESAYVCTGGDAAGCAVLRETHKLRCALSKLTEGNGDDDFGEEHEPGDFFGVGSEGPDSGLLDDGGWLSARSCPATSDPVLSRLGGNVSEGLSALCDGASVLAAYVLILGFMHAAWILGRAASGSAS